MANVRRPAVPDAQAADPTAPVGGLHPLTVLCIGVLVTAVALPESWQGWPYAPFPVFHACLAIVIPLWFRVRPTGRPWPEIRAHLPKQGRPFAAAIAFIGGFILLYSLAMTVLGKTRDPAWNLLATYGKFADLYAARYGSWFALIIAYVFLGLWPMFGEELFYRGFLQGSLLGRYSLPIASVVTSTLFGLRHSAQLVYLLPAYPYVAGAAYFVWAFGVSMIWCWVHARTGSLWLCMATHGVNIVLAPIVVALVVK
ncbi:CPBP family intramembrane glutamic endopeptidase [Streptomyces sp. NBC_00162]|uniref:CPBP family intramembrane glutamic endopeptidase n=1 Tax=Streptomyces sp. NBC_00162 TaxID=2903629 RepID=UPI00214BEBAA|nr:type II CAAX endopeptidase family protein [Streptomyces sp. NBC_00162]UUU44254.1 CPBP family intramembrane metalloprotease [Streptomyces sp. NBC_00162]